MEFDGKHIFFNKEECWATAVDPVVPYAGVSKAYGQVMRSRNGAVARFVELAVNADVEALTDEDIAELPDIANRIRYIDEIAEKLIPILIPRMADLLETAPPPYAG